GARGGSTKIDFRKQCRVGFAQIRIELFNPCHRGYHVEVFGNRRCDQIIENRIVVQPPPVGAHCRRSRSGTDGRRVGVCRRQHRLRPLVVGAQHATRKRKGKNHQRATMHHAILFSIPAGATVGSGLRRVRSTKNSGIKMVAMKVAASIPPNTPVPIERRAAAPAPVASTSGTTPSTNASEVITMGRKRKRAASSAASTGDNPFACSCTANPTIR